MNDAAGKPPAQLPAHAGLFNSSITRVRPLFCRLLSDDPTGASWLPALLTAAPGTQRLPGDVRAHPGPIDQRLVIRREIKVTALGAVISLERCFEYSVPPPTEFLRWLLEHPEQLHWPKTSNGKQREYGSRTQDWRTAFLATDADGTERLALQAEALDELETRRGRGSRRKRWAFEGFTEVDCFFETDKLVLAIEGKRNEPVSSSTDWYPQRSQLVRNLEALRELAEGRSTAVLLVTEHPVEGELSEDVVETSLPHVAEKAARAAIASGYVGQMTWRQLCDVLGVAFETLPETKVEAFEQLKAQGRVVELLKG